MAQPVEVLSHLQIPLDPKLGPFFLWYPGMDLYRTQGVVCLVPSVPGIGSRYATLISLK